MGHSNSLDLLSFSLETRVTLLSAILVFHAFLFLTTRNKIISRISTIEPEPPPVSRVAFIISGRVADADLAPSSEDAGRWYNYIVSPQMEEGIRVDLYLCLAEPLGLDTESLSLLLPRAEFVFPATSQFERWQKCAVFVQGEEPVPYDWYIILRPDLQLFAPLPALIDGALNASNVHTRTRGAYLTDGLFPGLTGDHFSHGFYSSDCGDFTPRDGVPRPWVMADDQLLVVPVQHWQAVYDIETTWASPEYADCNAWIPITRLAPPYGTGVDSFPEADLTRGLMCGGTGVIQPLQVAARIKRPRTHEGNCDAIPCSPPVAKFCGTMP